METLQTIYKTLSSIFCEPTTAITDFMLSAFCLWCYKAVLSYNRKREYRSHWALFFLFVACSTFFGGCAHSVSCLQNTLYYKIAWLLMQLSSGISLYFAQKAVFSTEVKNPKTKSILNTLALIQIISFCVCVIVFMDFIVVATNSLIGLLQLLIICFPKTRTKLAYKSLVSLGFLTSFLTIYVNRTQLSYAYWFNYNDISHLIIFTSLLLLYKAIKHKPNLENFLKTF